MVTGSYPGWLRPYLTRLTVLTTFASVSLHTARKLCKTTQKSEFGVCRGNVSRVVSEEQQHIHPASFLEVDGSRKHSVDGVIGFEWTEVGRQVRDGRVTLVSSDAGKVNVENLRQEHSDAELPLSTAILWRDGQVSAVDDDRLSWACEWRWTDVSVSDSVTRADQLNDEVVAAVDVVVDEELHVWHLVEAVAIPSRSVTFKRGDESIDVIVTKASDDDVRSIVQCSVDWQRLTVEQLRTTYYQRLFSTNLRHTIIRELLLCVTLNVAYHLIKYNLPRFGKLVGLS